jgi:hypothetical protein
MRIPKSNYDDAVAPAWLPIRSTAGEPLKPLIRCRCGQLCGIRLHSVNVKGEVRASFLHQWPDVPPERQGCGWHEFIELDGYETDPDYAGKDFPPQP